ncbi:MAG: VOC family protein [Pseudomonadota bacterium]
MNRHRTLLALAALTIAGCQTTPLSVDKAASIRDTQTSILGINHIGLSVRDLDLALSFYQTASGFELVSRETVDSNPAADEFFGQPGIRYEIAVLKAPNMMFELIEFAGNRDLPAATKPRNGPGMTHTCFQSPIEDPGFDKFVTAGATPISRGGQPVDLGGYGVTYAYAYDPEGNMIELEQLDGAVLQRTDYDTAVEERGENLWMSQVAIATPDIDRLMQFYAEVLGIAPYRITEVGGNNKIDAIVDFDNTRIIGGWFRMNQASKVMEFWQFLNPATPSTTMPRAVTELGYTFSLEASDIQAEYRRLVSLGVGVVSEPVQMGNFWQFLARDVDGNVFSVRQAIDPQSPYSVRALDRL